MVRYETYRWNLGLVVVAEGQGFAVASENRARIADVGANNVGVVHHAHDPRAAHEVELPLLLGSLFESGIHGSEPVGVFVCACAM